MHIAIVFDGTTVDMVSYYRHHNELVVVGLYHGSERECVSYCDKLRTTSFSVLIEDNIFRSHTVYLMSRLHWTKWRVVRNSMSLCNMRRRILSMAKKRQLRFATNENVDMVMRGLTEIVINTGYLSGECTLAILLVRLAMDDDQP